MAYKHPLNRIVPTSLKTALRRTASNFIPSLRHLDMDKRIARMKLNGFQPRTIVDVGAAVGNWSRSVAAVWPGAKLLAVEPNAHYVAALEQTQREVPNFQFRRSFLGREQKIVKYKNRDDSTSLVDANSNGAPDAEAPMSTLDDMIAETGLGSCDLLKIDVQGYELEVLGGATRTLPQIQCVIAEVNFFRYGQSTPLAQEVIAFLADHGFVWYDVAGILRRPLDDALGQMDLVFVPRESKLRQSNAWS